MKTYSYHLLYNWSDLIADIGGYLGLFLGMSVFGIISIFSQFIHEEKPKKVFNLAKQTSLIVRESMIIPNFTKAQDEMVTAKRIISADTKSVKSMPGRVDSVL